MVHKLILSAGWYFYETKDPYSENCFQLEMKTHTGHKDIREFIHYIHSTPPSSIDLVYRHDQENNSIEILYDSCR